MLIHFAYLLLIVIRVDSSLPIFSDFGPIEKTYFWGIAPKRQQEHNKLHLGGPMYFWHPFLHRFSTFQTLAKA